MIKLSLPAQWTVQAVGDLAEVPEAIRGKVIPARVPGTIHGALLAAGLIPDPYWGDNEKAVQWIGRTDWQFQCVFDADAAVLAHEHIELACDGLDTVATVTLNGKVVGESANQHVRQRFDVRGVLKPAGNELVITFASAVKYAKAQEERLGTMPYFNGPAGPFGFIRKMPCNFGWDWGAALVTCGPWKDIRVEGWSAVRIAAVRPHVVALNNAQAIVDVHVDLQGSAPAEVTLTAPDGTTHRGRGTGVVRVNVTDPAIWWPRGHGEQPLYAIRVTTGDDAWTGRIGLRTVGLDLSEDAHGQAFTVQINGKPIFCRGANWIPDDCLLERATDPVRLRERLTQGIDAGMNMLRVWGGGLYETDAFYDICDELGVLVYQDFLFACNMAPEEEPFWSLVEAEARDNVKRLAHHASLAIWNGGNECLQGIVDWGWGEKVQGRTWGLGYFLDLLPRVVAELDPSRPYWPNCPYSGAWDNGKPHPNMPERGTSHYWRSWFSDNYDAYRLAVPRFASEFGFQAPPTWATLTQAIPADQLFYDAPLMAHHQKSPQGDKNNRRHLLDWFVEPAAYQDHHYLLQINQARALTLGVEWFRSRMPVCMGTLYWQLNDCWPVVSWAAVDRGMDGQSRPKPLWYATRRFYADQLLTIQPVHATDEKQPQQRIPLAVYAVNDSDAAWSTSMEMVRMRFDGSVIARATASFEAPPRSCVSVPIPQKVEQAGDAAGELLVAHAADGRRALWYYLPDKQLRYPSPSFDRKLERTPEGYALTITAHTLLRDLCVFVDRLDASARISDQMVDLLPGDSVTFTIITSVPMTVEALTVPPVMQVANRFGAGVGKS